MFSQWQEGGRGDVPHMLVVCTLHVTNSGPAPFFQILNAYLKKPHAEKLGYVDTRVLYPGMHAHTMRFHFEIAPPVAKTGEIFKAEIVLVDQHGKQHAAKVQFKPLGMAVWDKMGKS